MGNGWIEEAREMYLTRDGLVEFLKFAKFGLAETIHVPIEAYRNAFNLFDQQKMTELTSTQIVIRECQGVFAVYLVFL